MSVYNFKNVEVTFVSKKVDPKYNNKIKFYFRLNNSRQYDELYNDINNCYYKPLFVDKIKNEYMLTIGISDTDISPEKLHKGMYNFERNNTYNVDLKFDHGNQNRFKSYTCDVKMYNIKLKADDDFLSDED